MIPHNFFRDRSAKSSISTVGGGERLTITLSSSCAAGLRPLERLLFSIMDVSEGVVALELAWQTLVEGAILPDAVGILAS